MRYCPVLIRPTFFSLLLSLLALAPACGIRKPVVNPSPSPSTSTQPSPQPSTSPLVTAKILPDLSTNDAVVAEAERLKQSGQLTELIVLESYPVQITATGTVAAIQKLKQLAAGQTGRVLSFETLSVRSSKITASETSAVSDQSSWEELWKRHYGSDADRPLINFETETVLAVFAGLKRTGGYSIRITEVRLQNAELQISYQETVPAGDSLVSQNLSSPAHLVKVRSSRLAGDYSAVRFIKVGS